MRTIEPDTTTADATLPPATDSKPAVRRWVGYAAIALALVLGMFVGAFAFGAGDDETEVVSATELTDRQQEMVEIVPQYIGAWQDTDGDAAASFMTDSGVVRYTPQGSNYHVSDDTLQLHISNGPYDGLRTVDPMLVYENRIVLTGTIDDNLTWLSIVEFTESGDVEIVSETIQYWR